MRNLKLIPILIVAFLASCSHSATSFRALEAQRDSVLRAISTMMVREMEPEAVLSVVDSVEAVGLVDAFQAELLRAKVYGREESGIRKSRTICENLLQMPDLEPEQEANVLEYLCNLCRLRVDLSGQVEYGMRFVEICDAIGDPLRALPVKAEIGVAMMHLGRQEQGAQMLDDAIKELDGVERFSGMDAQIRVLKRKIDYLLESERYLEAVPEAQKIIGRLEDFAACPEAYADGSPNLPDDSSRSGYIDFYTGQARAFMTYAYASAGMIKEAREQEALFEKTDFSRTFGGRKLISGAWAQMGEFGKMLTFYDELERRWGADTLHYDYTVMLKNRALAARSQGRTRDALDYMFRYSSLMSTVVNEESRASAQEYAARYHEKEQQFALERERARAKRSRIISMTLTLVILLFVVLLVVITYYVTAVRNKNKVLTAQISENVTRQGQEIRQSRNSSEPDLSSMNEAQLFEYLRYVIVKEELYKDSRLDRQLIMDRFHLSKEKIGAAFSHGSPYQSLAAFLNVVRLKSAAKLLSSAPEMSISDVAAACGFSSGSLFARNFKQYFALTPTEFRRNPEGTDRS